ncbi:MAG: gamma-glutamyltransferase, partial [Stellaceae bacterium]
SWMDSSGQRHHGLLTEDDLGGWEPTYEPAVAADYSGYTVFKTGPWGQGPVFLQQLQLLAGFDLKGMGHGTAEYVHVITECAKLAFADREAWYGDPLFADVPVTALMSKDYADERRELVSEESSPELRPGAPGGRAPQLPDFATGISRAPGEATGKPVMPGLQGDTVHLDVVDRDGNMVSATPSGGWLSGAPVVPELGFCLGTRGQMFWLEEGLPASLAPGKRPRSTLSPSMAFKDGKPYLAFGTPGGDQQDQWSLLMFLHHVHQGMNLQEAIDCPAFHTEHMPSSFYPRAAQPGLVAIESRFPDATRESLARRGHRLRVGDPWSEGRLSGCAREETPEGRTFKAGANPRGMQGYAVGR